MLRLANAQEKVPADRYISATIPDSLKENSNSVTRYYFEDVVVKAPGKATINVHQIETILNEDADREAALVLHYDRKFSEVNHAEMRVFDRSGTLLKRYKKSDFYDHAAADGMSLITDNRVLSVVHAVVNYPVTIEKTYKITLNSFLTLSDWDILGENKSVQQARYKISCKSSLGFRYKLYNFKQAPERKVEEDYETLRWDVKNLKAIKPEASSKSWKYLPRVAFGVNQVAYNNIPADMSTWKTFGAWIQELNNGASDLSPKRIEQINELVKGADSDKAKARILYDYIQKNTRYVSIQLGIGGLKPFPASFVDGKKYGDCKALSNYMHTLLKCVGIPSYYTLVRAGANEPATDPEFVKDPFNHIILCIPFKNDTTWLECTSTTNSFGKLGPFTENRNALLITEDGGKLVNTPRSHASDHSLDTEVNVLINSDGTADASMQIRSTGEYRDVFIGLGTQRTDEQKKFLINYLNLKQPDSFEILNQSDKDGVKEVKINLLYNQLSDISVGGKYFYKPRIFDLVKFTVPHLERRTSDFYIEHPMSKKSTTVYTLPQDLEIETLPSNTKHTFSHGNYSAEYSYDKVKNQMTAVARFELNNNIIPASSYNEMQKHFDDVAKSMNKKFVVRKKG
jgi:hypothetical protein